MGILQILGCGFFVLILWLILQQYKSDFRYLLVIVFGILIFLNLAGPLQNTMQMLLQWSMKAGANIIYLTTIFKIVGIAWLTEFLCQVCRDAGSSALAIKLEFAAKTAILLLLFPVLTAILESVIQMI